MKNLNRRDAIKLVGAGCALTMVPKVLLGFDHRQEDPLQVKINRFMMKTDFPRLEIISPSYRFLWQGRHFGFQIAAVNAQASYDEKLNFAAFGPFETGGLDLICYNPHPDGMPTLWAGDKKVSPAHGKLAQNTKNKDTEFRIEYDCGEERFIRLYLRFLSEGKKIDLSVQPIGFNSDESMFWEFPGNLIYDKDSTGKYSAAYYASGVGAGLCIAGQDTESVKAENTEFGKKLVCKIPLKAESNWRLTILSENDWKNVLANDEKVPDESTLTGLQFEALETIKMKSWEVDEMERHGWEPKHGRVGERVAAVFMQEDQIDSFLSRLAGTGGFEAIGMHTGINPSGGGDTPLGKTGEKWRKVTKIAHSKGFRVYFKPTDSALRVIRTPEGINAWVKEFLDAPREEQPDVIRLAWESIFRPWVTANLRLEPEFYYLISNKNNLQGKPWPEVQMRIVDALTDRISFFIESVRKYAPGITFDIESAYTPVLDKLMARHENLGVMYMMYGVYPHVTDYMDLYQCVARYQQKGKRIVLETDTNFTTSWRDSVVKGQNRPESNGRMTPDDIKQIGDKHKYLNTLECDAYWSFGVSPRTSEELMNAVCVDRRNRF